MMTLTASGGYEKVQVGASVHLRATSALIAHLYPDEDRVSLALGAWPSSLRLDLYADRAALVRLREFLVDTVAALDAAQADAEVMIGPAATSTATTETTRTRNDTAA